MQAGDIQAGPRLGRHQGRDAVHQPHLAHQHAPGLGRGQQGQRRDGAGLRSSMGGQQRTQPQANQRHILGAGCRTQEGHGPMNAGDARAGHVLRRQHAQRVARARPVEPQRRNTARGEHVRQHAPALVRAVCLVPERAAQDDGPA